MVHLVLGSQQLSLCLMELVELLPCVYNIDIIGLLCPFEILGTGRKQNMA